MYYFKNNFSKNFYNIVNISMFILYFITLSGIIIIDVKYISLLDIIVKFCVSLFLIMRFGPLSSEHVNKFDIKIAFTAGVFLFLSSSITIAIQKYLYPTQFLI